MILFTTIDPAVPRTGAPGKIHGQGGSCNGSPGIAPLPYQSCFATECLIVGKLIIFLCVWCSKRCGCGCLQSIEVIDVDVEF